MCAFIEKLNGGNLLAVEMAAVFSFAQLVSLLNCRMKFRKHLLTTVGVCSLVLSKTRPKFRLLKEVWTFVI